MSTESETDPIELKSIDEERLETDVLYRFEYVTEFLGFDAQDIEMIHASAELLAPQVPGLVDAIYDKLFQYDATKRHFVSRGKDFEGPVAVSLEALTLDHAQIAFCKQLLARYLEKLVTSNYHEKMGAYLNLVGAIHSPSKGSESIQTPLVHVNALLGFVADAITGTILSLDLDRKSEIRAIRAFGKLFWVQNDLITRHYQGL